MGLKINCISKITSQSNLQNGRLLCCLWRRIKSFLVLMTVLDEVALTPRRRVEKLLPESLVSTRFKSGDSKTLCLCEVYRAMQWMDGSISPSFCQKVRGNSDLFIHCIQRDIWLLTFRFNIFIYFLTILVADRPGSCTLNIMAKFLQNLVIIEQLPFQCRSVDAKYCRINKHVA